MAYVEALVQKAKLKNKHSDEEEKFKAETLVTIPTVITGLSYRRDDDDSPTSLFTNEGVESTAIQSVSRLMNMWKSQIHERKENFQSPEEYINNVNNVFSSYQGIRFRIDSSVAFLIGDLLNECKTRFFNEDKKVGKNWLDFLKDNISFSVRQAYDFMSISSKLSFIRGKKLTMEQFRALLSLHSSGFELHKIPENIELLSPSSILNLKNIVLDTNQEIKKQPSRKQAIANIFPLVSKLERMVIDFDNLPISTSRITSENMSDKEKNQILSLKTKLESVLSLINKNIF